MICYHFVVGLLSYMFPYVCRMYTDTREVASNAVAAAEAYKDIVGAIASAHDAAQEALQAAEDAFTKVSY
jgi:hypothetical protein